MKELKNHTIALMIGTALFFDSLQWLLAFVFMDWLAGFFAFLTFFVWFKFYGMKFITPKRIATMGGAFLIEIIPVLAALPAWTGAVVILILDMKAKKLLSGDIKGALGAKTEPTFQKGPPQPTRPVRPTLEHLRYLNTLKPELYGNAPVRTPVKSIDSLQKAPVNELEFATQRFPKNTATIQTEDENEIMSSLGGVGNQLEKDSSGKIIEQNIDWNNLVFVRADTYSPKVTSGGVMIENAYDATGGKTKRLTNHFSLNHRVASNIGGSWENSPYTFIIPAKKMVEDNGNPDNLYSVDSFWAKSVKLPPGSVIIHEPGQKPDLGINENKYVLIERTPDNDRDKLLSGIITKMGYTEVRGSDRGVAMRDQNFDTNLENYAKKNGVRWGLHEFSWSEAWESAQAALKENHPSQAFGIFLNLEKDSQEVSRMPIDLKSSLVKEIFRELQSEPEKGKDLANIVGDVLESNMPDKKLIIEAVPIPTWKSIYEEMLMEAALGGVYENREEAVEAFNKLFAQPFEEITGHKLSDIIKE
jgi:hypothetical protein